jgi:hypothetical protein
VAIAEGELRESNGEIVLSVTYPSDQLLEQNPERAVGVLVTAVWLRLFDIMHSSEAAPPPAIFELLWKWIYAREPLKRKVAMALAQRQGDHWTRNMILMWAGKRGRPIKLRRASIMALFRREYFKKPWREVTRRVCPCGKSHLDPNKVTEVCQPRLEADVRNLKRLLHECGIKFPPAPSK